MWTAPPRGTQILTTAGTVSLLHHSSQSIHCRRRACGPLIPHTAHGRFRCTSFAKDGQRTRTFMDWGPIGSPWRRLPLTDFSRPTPPSLCAPCKLPSEYLEPTRRPGGRRARPIAKNWRTVDEPDRDLVGRGGLLYLTEIGQWRVGLPCERESSASSESSTHGPGQYTLAVAASSGDERSMCQLYATGGIVECTVWAPPRTVTVALSGGHC
ncbi:MAG: hypothetical protein ACI9OJ_001230 [Myxococcota bacterium]|jgi:hypothetical protein